MRCKNCDYPLFNIAARQCPECGEAFLPTDFEFVLNAVAFCCPHCDKAYYGRGVQGHLEPRRFTCVSCHNRIDMDEMVLRPAAGVSDEQTQPDVHPWLERGKSGWMRAWLRTAGMSMLHPRLLMQATPMDSSAGSAFGFAALSMLLASVVMFLQMTCLTVAPAILAANSAAGNAGPQAGAIAGAMVATFAGMFIFGLVWGLAWIGIWAVSIQGFARVGGAPVGGLGRTLHAVGYTSGVMVLSAVPCFGALAGIWWLVVAVPAVQQAHQMSMTRSIFATLLLPVITILLGVGLYVWLIVFSLGIAGTMFSSIGNATLDTDFMSTRLFEYVDENGAWPRHAIELFSNEWGVNGFLATESGTESTEAATPIGDITLEAFKALPPNRRQMVIDAAAEALPDDVVAHRLGDFMFTYHGMPVDPEDPDLWVLIISRDPDQVVAPIGPKNFHVVVALTAGGETVLLDEDGGIGDQTLWQAQNDKRALIGLPPLPKPNDVTHGQPARAGGAAVPEGGDDP